MNNIRWQSVERSELPKALFGKRPSGLVGHLPDTLMEGHGLALGYVDFHEDESYCPPALLVLEDSTAAEVLSWVRTFAPSPSINLPASCCALISSGLVNREIGKGVLYREEIYGHP